MGYLVLGGIALYLYAKSKGITISQVLTSAGIPGVPSDTIGNIGPGATLGGTQAQGTSFSVPGAAPTTLALTGTLAPNPACGCSLESPGYQPQGVITQNVAPKFSGPYAGF